MDTKETELNKKSDNSADKKDDEIDQNDLESMVKHIEELAGENGFDEETLEKVNEYLAENAKSDDDEIKSKISKNFNDLGNKYQFSNPKEAVKYFKIAMDLGNTNGMVNYGSMFLYGFGVEFNPKEAAKYYKTAADKGNIFGIVNYAKMLEDGFGVDKDIKEAVKYHKIAADLGNIDATVKYANCILDGKGVEYNKEEAEKYYKMAIEKGSTEAILSYIVLLKSENNLEEAEKYYKMAIEKGSTVAMFDYAEALRKGDGFEKNSEKAKEYYKMAIDKGNAAAMFNYAYMLENGEGVEQNLKEAEEYYKIAIRDGSFNDIYNFAFNLEKGTNGIERDYKKALEFYQAAENRGCNYCYNNMGNIYLNGAYGVEENYDKAIKYFTKAAELGNKDAIYNLGFCYKNGYGVEENYEKALEYYEKAAEQNQPDAINALGNRYKFGHGGVEIDYTKANEYYEKAADLGCTDAMVNLGNAYLCGDGFEIDETKALEYFDKAAELGNTDAIALIFCYKENELYNKIGLSKLEKYCQIEANDGNDTYYNSLAEICLKNGETEKALDYYKKLAEKGDNEALTFLGNAYYKGEYGFKKNEGKALEYFNKVVDNGNGYFINKIAENFLDGENGFKKDFEKAKYFYEKAVEKGDIDALMFFGSAYIKGENGFEKDFEKAKYFYEKAVEKGSAKAMRELGEVYFYGKYDVEVDRNLAVEYFKEAAIRGESISAFRIATIYDNQENLDEAIKYYKIATKRGSTYAAVNLAYLYENGIGVEKNEVEAAWLYGTVEDPKFIFDLAQGYEEGELGKRDFERAKRFYEMAKEKGYEIDEKKFSELDKLILEENKVQESINDRNNEYEKIKEDIYKEIKEEAKKATNVDYTEVSTLKQLTDKYRGELEITKEITKRLESTKEFVKSPVTVKNMAKCINNKEKNPTTADIAPILDYIPNEEDITKDSVFRDMTLPAIKVGDKEYEGFGAKMLNSNDNKIRLCFNDDGFMVEQLERMGLKEEAEIFKNGAIVIDGQGKLSQKDINEFHLKFKVSPIEACLDICEKGAKINYSDDKKSFEGQEVTEEFKNKIVNGLAVATESRRVLADISRCSENISKSGNEEYKQIAEFIKEYSSKILEKTEVDKDITDGCQIKSSFMVAKQAVELLKAMDNAANGKTNSIEQAQTLRDLSPIKFNLNANNEKCKKEYFINCINKTISNNLGAVDRHLSAELVKNKSKASGRLM